MKREMVLKKMRLPKTRRFYIKARINRFKKTGPEKESIFLKQIFGKLIY